MGADWKIGYISAMSQEKAKSVVCLKYADSFV